MIPFRILCAAALLIAASAHAQTATTGHDGMSGMSSMAPAAASGTKNPSAMSEGEVRKVDKAQNKLTLRHGPIANLDMSAMTMVFRVADPRLLEGLKVGDKVRFHAEQPNGVLTVTAIEPATR